MDYTPSQPQQQAPQVTYELKKDVTGKPPPERGLQLISAVRYIKQDGKEVKHTINVRVPHKPKSNCKVCYGRGYKGWTADDQVIACPKCYKGIRFTNG